MTTASEPAPATAPLSPKAQRVRSALLVTALVFFGIALVALVAAIVSDAVDPTIYNPLRFVFVAVPFAIVLGMNAMVWRALVGPISRSAPSSRALFVILVTLVLAVVSIILVLLLVVLSSFLPFS